MEILFVETTENIYNIMMASDTHILKFTTWIA